MEVAGNPSVVADRADLRRRLPVGRRRRRRQPLLRPRHRRADDAAPRSRPIPSGRVAPRAALTFGIALAALSFVLMSLTLNVLAASLALAGFVGYVGVYTIWLKRRTPQNIVIGGAAGAIPPLVGWAATRGSLSWTAVYLFAIVFYWTPPHFWALSLLMKDEYAKVGVPMLPVVRGEQETRRQILLYTLLLYAVTQLPFCAGEFGGIYLAASMVLGLAFIARRGAGCTAAPTAGRALRLYLFSLLYLALLFARWSPTSSSEAASRHVPKRLGFDAMDRKLARKNLRAGLIAGSDLLLHVRHHVPRRRDLRPP